MANIWYVILNSGGNCISNCNPNILLCLKIYVFVNKYSASNYEWSGCCLKKYGAESWGLEAQMTWAPNDQPKNGCKANICSIKSLLELTANITHLHSQ